MPKRPVRSTRNTNVNYAESVTSAISDNDSEYVPDSEEIEMSLKEYSVSQKYAYSAFVPKYNTRIQTRSSSQSNSTTDNEEASSNQNEYSFRNIGESRVQTRSAARQSASEDVRRSTRLRVQKY
jgi:predicted S18 family serine protease